MIGDIGEKGGPREQRNGSGEKKTVEEKRKAR